MADIQIYGGTLLATDDERTFDARLVPFGEEASSNLGHFTVDPDVFEVPGDGASAVFNVDHERELVSGTLAAIRQESDGIWSRFHFDKSPQGEKALADVKAGRRKAVSVEAADVVIRAGKAISGRIFGAALVKAGAFPSATLLAAAADTSDEEVSLPTPPAPGGEPTETTTTNTDEVEDENGVKHTRTTTTTTKAETDADGNSKTTITTVEVIEEPGAPAADTNTENKEGTAVGVPNTLNASKVEATTARPKLDIHKIVKAMADVKANPLGATEARTLLASLNDIKISGDGSLPSGGEVLQPSWLGLLEQGDTYQRQYITLGQLGTDITAAGKKGFSVRRGTAQSPVDTYAPQADWAGNKAQIFSGQGFTTNRTSVLDRFAIGEDIAREFYDLPGGEEAIIAFLSMLDEDYQIWSDNKALAYWQAAAGAPVAANPDIPTDYTGALGMLIQGITAIKKPKYDHRRDTPTFAILNDAAYEDILYTPFEKIPEFIKFSANTDGTGTADGDVVLVNGDTGITDSPSVTVGARKAIQFDELAGGPLHVDALNIAQGGIDKAVHGYLQTFEVRPEAVMTIGVGDTRANSTAYAPGRIIKAGAVTYRVTTGGSTGSSAPTAPAVGATVTDGTAVLTRLS